MPGVFKKQQSTTTMDCICFHGIILRYPYKLLEHLTTLTFLQKKTRVWYLCPATRRKKSSGLGSQQLSVQSSPAKRTGKPSWSKYSSASWCRVGNGEREKNSRTTMYMDVSKNNGTSKSSILIGFSIINHPFWGTPIFGNIHIGSGYPLPLIN